MVNWSRIRAQFPATKKFTYLNAASGSPLSGKAASEGKRFYDEMLAHGDTIWEEWLTRREKARERLARFINADNSEIAFITNTSFGMNIIAEMLRGKGDVITMNDEFPSTTFPWLHRKYPVHFVQPSNAVYSLDTIERTMTKKTGILVTSHVQYCTGFKQDLVGLGNLCKRKGLVYVVNATQSLGAMPIDVRKARIDFLAFMGLKWPIAGYGVGGLYINKKWLGKLPFPLVGWQSVQKPELMDNRNLKLKKEASALELGCPHFPTIFALGGALAFLDRIGKENIRKRIYELNDYLVSRLRDLDLEIVSPLQRKYRSGITIVRMDRPETVVQKLLEKKIIISARGEGIRVSVHVYNNKRDIDKFVLELGRILKKGKG